MEKIFTVDQPLSAVNERGLQQIQAHTETQTKVNVCPSCAFIAIELFISG